MKNIYSFTQSAFKVFTVLLFGLLISGENLRAQNGAALHFDATGVSNVYDHVVIPASPAFNFGTALTIEAWIKTNNYSEAYLTDKAEDSWYFAVNGGNLSDGRLTFFCNGPQPSGWVIGNDSVTDGNWHHVAVTYDGASMKILVDGLLDAVSTKTGAIATGTNDVFIGQRPFFGYDRHFDGSMDELRIWNVARSQCEIIQYMRCEITSTASGLVANYHFNQGIAGATNTGAILNDATGAHNGTMLNFALTGSVSNWVSPGGVTSGSTTPSNIFNLHTTSSNSLVCAGQTAILSASGVNSYTWNTGSNSPTLQVSPSTTTTYSVTGNVGVCTGQSAITVNVDNCTGIPEHSQNLFSVFPNPAKDKLSFSFERDPGTIRVELISVEGRSIKSQELTASQNQIDVSGLPNGMYYLKAETETGTILKKFTKE